MARHHIVYSLAITTSALLWIATVLRQHPNRSVDLLARTRTDRQALTDHLIPDWRFFAPRPASNDYHLYYRTLDALDIVSPWSPTIVYEKRALHQLLYFRTRRQSKAVIDAINQLQTLLIYVPAEAIARHNIHELLARIARRHASRSLCAAEQDSLDGMQFCVVKDDGYATTDLSNFEVIFMSAYLPWKTSAEVDPKLIPSVRKEIT